jgi:hypothetical protein
MLNVTKPNYMKSSLSSFDVVALLPFDVEHSLLFNDAPLMPVDKAAHLPLLLDMKISSSSSLLSHKNHGLFARCLLVASLLNVCFIHLEYNLRSSYRISSMVWEDHPCHQNGLPTSVRSSCRISSMVQEGHPGHRNVLPTSTMDKGLPLNWKHAKTHRPAGLRHPTTTITLNLQPHHQAQP